MKRLFILTALIALAASCGKEPAESPVQGATALSFTYESGRTTRTTVPALAAEKEVRDMDVFICAGGQFVRQLGVGDYTERTEAGQTTLRMTMDFILEFANEQVVFYFVGNNASSVGGKHIDPEKFEGTVTQEQFEGLLSSPLADSPWYPAGTKAELIGTVDDVRAPSKTYGLLMTARSEFRIAGKHAETIELKRRVARFDVKNPAPSAYSIDMFYVSDARVQTPMFAASSIDIGGIGTRSLEDIYGPLERDYGDDKIAPCVFYLYPTDLATTTIVAGVQNISTGETNLFAVGSDIAIEANKRYILYFDEATLEIGVGVGDYDETIEL